MHIDELRAEHRMGIIGPACDAVNTARVIIGRCRVTGNKFLLFGRARLETITEDALLRGELDPRLEIELDQTEASGDLEFIVSVIASLRGHCDYGDPRTED